MHHYLIRILQTIESILCHNFTQICPEVSLVFTYFSLRFQFNLPFKTFQLKMFYLFYFCNSPPKHLSVCYPWVNWQYRRGHSTWGSRCQDPHQLRSALQYGLSRSKEVWNLHPASWCQGGDTVSEDKTSHGRQEVCSSPVW